MNPEVLAKLQEAIRFAQAQGWHAVLIVGVSAAESGWIGFTGNKYIGIGLAESARATILATLTPTTPPPLPTTPVGPPKDVS